MQNPYLIGDKIYLRPLERDDAPTLQPWINDSDVTRTLLIYRPVNRVLEEEFVDKALRSDHDVVLGITVRETDRLIGVAGLHLIDFKNRHSGFGITIGEKGEWGKGYGSEATQLMVGYAFNTLNLNRVWLEAYEYNQRGIHIYEKVGFLKEGTLRQDHYLEGRYWNTILMGILREDWTAGKSETR